MTVAILMDKEKPDPGHRSSHELPAGAPPSCGRSSKYKSSSRTSQTLRPSMRRGPGIRPYNTNWSNLAGEMPMYIAASSRDRPRRGTGRISERARAMVTDLNADYARSLHGAAAVNALGLKHSTIFAGGALCRDLLAYHYIRKALLFPVGRLAACWLNGGTTVDVEPLAGRLPTPQRRA